MPLKKLVAGLLLCLCCDTLLAANPTFEGVVKDDLGNPLGFANVTLMSLNDSTVIAGAVTDVTGKFVIAGDCTSVLLKITAMGYEDKTINSPDANVGDVVLVPTSYMLGELVVKGSRPITKLKADGLQVNVSGSYLANTGTALDVLGKMPFVIKSGSEIEILGKGTPLIYIDGRQVRDVSELNQLASSQMKSVEIVTNPGARYASTVNSVIRITTVASVGEGLSFNDRTTVGYKHYVYLFEQVNLNWRKNGVDIFGMLNYENYRERTAFSESITKYLKSGTIHHNGFGQNFAKYPVYQGKLGLNYTLSSHNFGLYYDFIFKPSTITGDSFTDRYIDNILTENLENNSNSKHRNRQHLVSAYYAGVIGKWQLSANFDVLWQINNRNNRENEISNVNHKRDFTTNNNVDNRLLAANIIASVPVWKGDVKFGTELSNIHRNDRYLGNTYYITDSDVKIIETTTALFAETEQTFDAITARTGLRWEYTDATNWQSGQPRDSRKYHNLAPTASLSFPIGNIKARLSYMRKTSRPTFGQLSSAIKYIDRYSYESGNPGLRPIYRDYISASASWENLAIELEYCSTKNYFMWQTSEYPGNKDITLLTMVNMPKFSTYGAYINYTPTFFECWHPSIMAGINIQDFKIEHAGRVIILNRPLGIFRFDNAIHLPRNIWLNVDLSARTSGNGDNYYIKPHWQCNVGLYKSFVNDTWSIRLQLNDVFDTWRQDVTLYDAISCGSSKKIYDTRELSLTIRCNFNSARSRYKGRGAGNNDKNRF